MAKHITLILLSFLLFSCAARKVSISNAKVETHIDSTAVEKKDSVSVNQNAISIKEDIDEVEITPIDTAKPIIVGDKKYFNAKVKVRKVRKHIVDTSKNTVSQSAENKISVNSSLKSEVFEKKVDKKANYLFYLWLLLIPVCLWLIWKFGDK